MAADHDGDRDGAEGKEHPRPRELSKRDGRLRLVMRTRRQRRGEGAERVEYGQQAWQVKSKSAALRQRLTEGRMWQKRVDVIVLCPDV